jgi:hypothetical protein
VQLHIKGIFSGSLDFVISNLKKCILLRFCIFSGVPEGEPASGLIVLEISVKIRLRQFKILPDKRSNIKVCFRTRKIVP